MGYIDALANLDRMHFPMWDASKTHALEIINQLNLVLRAEKAYKTFTLPIHVTSGSLQSPRARSRLGAVKQKDF